jgi:hypothetical protein
MSREVRLIIAALATVTAFAALLGVGCTSLPPEPAPQEHFDEATGATVTVAERPLLFARDRPVRGATIRDYLTLMPASVNRGGTYSYVVMSYAWSTLDLPNADPATAATLVITVDDRRLPFTASLTDPVPGSVSRPMLTPLLAPPGTATASHVYATDVDTLRLLANSHILRAQTSSSEAEPYFELWSDTRPALRGLVRYLDGDRN